MKKQYIDYDFNQSLSDALKKPHKDIFGGKKIITGNYLTDVVSPFNGNSTNKKIGSNLNIGINETIDSFGFGNNPLGSGGTNPNWNIVLGGNNSNKLPLKPLLKGKVVDEHGTPLPNATVNLKNNKEVGTTTDFDGNFSIKAPLNEVLEVRFLGFKTVQINGSKLNNPIVLMEDNEALDGFSIRTYLKKSKNYMPYVMVGTAVVIIGLMLKAKKKVVKKQSENVGLGATEVTI